MIKSLLTLLVLSLFSLTSQAIEVRKSSTPPKIDGLIDKPVWKNAQWQPMDELILGEQPNKDDFSGRYKLLWDSNKLYLLAEIQDDILFDQHPDPLHLYWDDDCLEVFIDEDASGGNHQFNYNAFAYHVALDNQVVDIGKSTAEGKVNFVLLNDHIDSKWQRSSEEPHKIVWEMAISIYDDRFNLSNKKDNSPVSLLKGKRLGFMLAYCDNDGSQHRESFIGSTQIKAINGDKNLGYITADVFDQITLVD